MIIQKQYARREIVGYVSPYVDPFDYRSLADLGNAAFIDALREVCAGSGGIDVLGYLNDPAKEFHELIEYAGSAFDSTHWFLAFEQQRLVGMVLPQRFHDLPIEGTVFHLGVVPAARGKGVGRILHARGLEAMARQSIERYVGSTHVENRAMIRVFECNDCVLTKIRDQEIPDWRSTSV